MKTKLTKAGRPTVIEKKKQIPRTIKFDTEEEAKLYLKLLRTCKSKSDNKKNGLMMLEILTFFIKNK